MIIMELYDKGSLLDLISYRRSRKLRVFNDELIISITKQIFTACAYLHSLNIIHKDMHPDNIMIDYYQGDDLKVRVVDFGIAQEKIEGFPLKFNFNEDSVNFWAPEVVK